ncbi:protein phosphatase pp2a regulatory subunit b [Anaeramoeba ignava]|uniref:Serine/threonine-protein phosphatase 2A 55 kDa regulatory subunit B n=1 Tax=Anaeramoeba ignava TaxID=1746090 RepID=A0A9Q0LXM7_ANAIG|nr:protein phosphatase pp2a regulatory subunit b [Anaeramoeba ignava]
MSFGWKVTQVFGDNSSPGPVNDCDIISALEFDTTGEYIAVGDRGGRVVLFQRESPPKYTDEIETNNSRLRGFKFYNEFQSHESEFDYLKSNEIEEKINSIKWLKPRNNANFLLSTNDKTIKLWKIYEKDTFIDNESALNFQEISSPSFLRIPKISKQKPTPSIHLRRVYSHAHVYDINSISVNPDQETFLSSDGLRINLWNLELTKNAFNIVDMKPEDLEDLTEVITDAKFHPNNCGLFCYSTSKGVIRLGDLRVSKTSTDSSKIFHYEDNESNSFFSEVINSISDIQFSFDGRYVVSRDFMSLKVWDLNMESKPVAIFHVHEFLTPKFGYLYENDYIIDKFECSFSHDGEHLITGSYGNHFYIIDWKREKAILVNASQNPHLNQQYFDAITPTNKNSPTTSALEYNIQKVDYSRKVLAVGWNPKEPIITFGATNILYLYAGKPL